MPRHAGLAYRSHDQLANQQNTQVQPRCVSFALWQTLIDEAARFGEDVQRSRAEVIAAAVAATGLHVPVRIAAAAYLRASDEFEAAYVARQPMSNATRVERVCTMLGAELSHTQRAQLQNQLEASHPSIGVRLLPGAVAALNSLSRSFRLILISDTWMTSGTQMRLEVARLGLARFFAHMHFSDESGSSKVTGRAFAAAAEEAGTRVEELIHVGDLLPVDGEAAIAAGCGAAVVVTADNHPVSMPVGPLSSDPRIARVAGMGEVQAAVVAATDLIRE